MKIVFENSDFIVVRKPFDVPCVRDLSKRKSVEEELTSYLSSPVFTVHRLDAATGGLVVFAKNKKTAAHLSECIRNGTFKKTYLAVVTGDPEDSASLSDCLLADTERNLVRVVSKEKKGAKIALLDYRTVKRISPYSLLDITLKTGRTHQIRVQLSSRNIFIVGDEKYGGPRFDSLCLFASKIEFPEPETQKIISFSASPENENMIWKKMLT